MKDACKTVFHLVRYDDSCVAASVSFLTLQKVGNVYVVNDAEKYDSQSNGGKVKISACASDKYK